MIFFPRISRYAHTVYPARQGLCLWTGFRLSVIVSTCLFTKLPWPKESEGTFGRFQNEFIKIHLFH